MMVCLSQNTVLEVAKSAARLQCWTDRNGIRGVPVRLDGEDYPGTNSDLTVIFDLLEQADALVWRGDELTLRFVRDVTRHIGIVRPGYDDVASDDIEIMGSRNFNWMLQLAEAADAARTRTATPPVLSVMTCFSPDCGLIGHPYPGRAEAEALAGIHNSVHHGGGRVAQAGTVVHPSDRAEMCWEVDAPDGTPLYRGRDVDLADALYRSSPAGSHLLPVMAVAGGR